jgi:peptidoglycan lytic transglycosylase
MPSWRRARVGAGALLIAIPACAGTLVASQALAAPTKDAPQITPRSVHVSYGDDLVARGTAATTDAGHTIVLQFSRRGQSGWRRLSSTTVGAGGAFRLAGTVNQSGVVRAVDTSTGTLTPFVARGTRGHAAPASTPVPVDVSARVRVPSRQVALVGGQAVKVRGGVLPGRAGRRVSLQAHRAGRWQTLSSARTGAAGGFALRYVAGDAGQERIRVKFAGDRLNGHSAASAGQMTVYREAGASWYNDGGNTACGFHARYGVANRTLPCGTTVAFRYNGRSVTATVDDRGPFVGGRDWDLDQTTAGALGFGGVGTVWSSQ